MERTPYDEFAHFHENASEHGLPFEQPPIVRREHVVLPDDRRLAALVWGHTPPEVLFIHGGAQNAHTWDTTIMALQRSAIAVDLAGHGHSSWRSDGAYSPQSLADDVAVAIGAMAPAVRLVVGMSLGGLTAMELAARHPALVLSLMMVDITPGVNRAKTKAVVDFIDGPQSFPSFDALLARTIEHNPTRSVSSLRRGILHNAREEPDGSWVWRYDRSSHARALDDVDGSSVDTQHSPLWEHFASISCPVTLVRGMLSPVVDIDDVSEALRLQPGLRVHEVAGAGHSVQGDRPLELAELVVAALSG